jgi:hypothetical protein
MWTSICLNCLLPLEYRYRYCCSLPAQHGVHTHQCHAAAGGGGDRQERPGPAALRLKEAGKCFVQWGEWCCRDGGRTTVRAPPPCALEREPLHKGGGAGDWAPAAPFFPLRAPLPLVGVLLPVPRCRARACCVEWSWWGACPHGAAGWLPQGFVCVFPGGQLLRSTEPGFEWDRQRTLQQPPRNTCFA